MSFILEIEVWDSVVVSATLRRLGMAVGWISCTSSRNFMEFLGQVNWCYTLGISWCFTKNLDGFRLTREPAKVSLSPETTLLMNINYITWLTWIPWCIEVQFQHVSTLNPQGTWSEQACDLRQGRCSGGDGRWHRVTQAMYIFIFYDILCIFTVSVYGDIIFYLCTVWSKEV